MWVRREENEREENEREEKERGGDSIIWLVIYY